MKINEAQATSPVWHALRTHYTERLAQLRADNDSTTLGEKDTAVLRGRIAEIKTLLNMDSPADEEISIAGM